MNLTNDGFRFLQQQEGCRLTAYLDSGGVATIGWGTTKYPDGRRVKLGDTCSQPEADGYFRHDLVHFERQVDALTVDLVTPQRFDPLVSFGYNVGVGAYKGSTLRKLVNANPDDLAIRAQFMKWHFDDGHPVEGLWRRRHREADYYFGVTTPCPVYPG